MEAIIGDTAAAVDGQQAPAFTADDELTELASLTVKEITEVEKDLLGVTADVEGLRLDASGGECGDGGNSAGSAPKRRKRANSAARASPPRRRSSLDDPAGLEQHLLNMPPNEKQSYVEACLKCPDLLSPEHKAAFLEYGDFDAHKAAVRLCEYWRVRVATFGPERAFLPMTLAGAMQDEVQGMIKHCPWSLMPNPDLSGRKILFLDAARRNFARFSEDQEARSLFYLLDILAFDPSARASGFVFLASTRSIDRKSFSFRIVKFFRHLTEDVIPMKFRGFHICFPSPVFYYVIFPVMRRVLGKDYRLRIRLHYGNEGEVIQSLEKYRFSKARLPKAVGGFCEMDYGQWVAGRSIIENLARTATAAKEAEAESLLTTVTSVNANGPDTVETARAAIVSEFNKSLLALAPEPTTQPSKNPPQPQNASLMPNDNSCALPNTSPYADGGTLAFGKQVFANDSTGHDRTKEETAAAAAAKILDKLPTDELDRFFQDQDFDDLPEIGGGDTSSNIADTEVDEIFTNMLNDE